MREMVLIYAGLLSQSKLNFQTMFLSRFFKLDEDDQVLDEVELYNNLNINRNLTESDIDSINLRSQLDQLIQNQEIKVSGWIFDKSNSMTMYIFWTYWNERNI